MQLKRDKIGIKGGKVAKLIDLTFLSRRLKRVSYHCTKTNRKDVTRIISAPVIKGAFPSIERNENAIVVDRTLKKECYQMKRYKAAKEKKKGNCKCMTYQPWQHILNVDFCDRRLQVFDRFGTYCIEAKMAPF